MGYLGPEEWFVPVARQQDSEGRGHYKTVEKISIRGWRFGWVVWVCNEKVAGCTETGRVSEIEMQRGIETQLGLCVSRLSKGGEKVVSNLGMKESIRAGGAGELMQHAIAFMQILPPVSAMIRFNSETWPYESSGPAVKAPAGYRCTLEESVVKHHFKQG